MMGVFDDHKLEQLDWMTQITETIESDLNGLLTSLPDRTLISEKDILESGGYSSIRLSVSSIVHNLIRLSVSSIVHNLIRQVPNKPVTTWEEDRLITMCFEFEIVGTDVELDLRTKTMNGQIFMVKKKTTLSDEDLQPLMGIKGLNALHSMIGDDSDLERINEILDVLGNCGEHMKNRSARKKLFALKDRLSDIFKTNEWRIRDMGLANKLCYWIKDYIIKGDLAALTNLCKLKVMTHSNMPIYSVKEET